MTVRFIEQTEGSGSSEQAVHALLREGMPIDLNARSAASFYERCSELLAGLPDPHSVLAVKLMATSVIALAKSDPAGAAQLAVETRRIADALHDEVAEAYALVSWGFSHPSPEHAKERVQAAYTVLDISSRHHEAALFPVGTLLLLVGLLEQGEIRSLDVEILEQQETAAKLTETAHPSPLRWLKCLRAMLDGDSELAEHIAEANYADAAKEGTEALALYTTQIGMIRWMQGRIDGLEDGFLRARREYPEQLLWPASLAWLWVLQGRRSAGEALLRTLPDLEEIPRDRYWLSTVTVLAEAARLTGPRERAMKLRAMLLPFADQLVPVGVGVAFWGTAARTLGLLEEHLGLLDDARSHLELAAVTSERLGALAWHAEALIELAEFALRHELTDIPAYDMLAEARATSEARGFPALARRAMHRPRIRVLGHFEVVSVCGVRADWNSRKARELLKMLVAARGTAVAREIFMDALWPGISPSRLGNRFSVAVNVVRRALDPDRLLPTQHHVVTEGDAIRLNLDAVEVDLEQFLDLAARDDAQSRQAAIRLYRGDVFSEEPYADWAVDVRAHAERVRASLG